MRVWGRDRRPWEVFVLDAFFPLTHCGTPSLAWPLPHAGILFVAPSRDNVLKRRLHTKPLILPLGGPVPNGNVDPLFKK